MSQILTDQIRHHLAPPGRFPGPSPTTALLAVLDTCDTLRQIPGQHAVADELVQTIARGLGLTEEI